MMKKVEQYEAFINEASRRKIHKAAKQGSYPAVIVVVQDGKVIHQEPVSTPDVAPATFNVMQEKYPKALLHLEDNTGKRLFSESVVTEAKNTIGLAFKDEDDYNGFVEFINDEGGKIFKNIGWDNKTKSWEVIMDVKVLDSIYGEGTPANKESGWYGALPGDFESVIIESVVTEGKFDGIADLVKSLHFETDPKTAEEKKIELGRKQGEVSRKKQIESAEYSLRRFRKEIKYGDGKNVDVFLPGSYDASASELGNGPHTKAVKPVKWNQRKYDQWLEDMAANGGADNAFDMAQNAKNEPGLIYWVTKEFRGEDPMQRIQWDIEAFAESVVTEAKDNLYLQLHKKYAESIKGLKAGKIKKLTDLVSVQRWSMEDREDYFDMDPKKRKELSAEYNEERKLFKKYIAGDESVMLPKGTEALAESLVTEEVVYNSSNTKPEAAKKATKEFGNLLPKANKGVEPYVFAVIKTKARNYRLAIKSGSYVAHEFMSGLKEDGILTAAGVKKAVANIIKLNPDEFNESVVTESKFANKDEVTVKQLADLKRDIAKINKNIKVYISTHPVTKGELSIELGADHDNDDEIDQINSLLKKHTGDHRTGSMFGESVVTESEAPASILKFMEDEIADGNDASIHLASFDGNSMEAQFTNKTWEDGVPVTKNFTRGGYKSVSPKGKIWILESERFWYFQYKGIWYAVKIADYGTPPFEY